MYQYVYLNDANCLVKKKKDNNKLKYITYNHQLSFFYSIIIKTYLIINSLYNTKCIYKTYIQNSSMDRMIPNLQNIKYYIV